MKFIKAIVTCLCLTLILNSSSLAAEPPGKIGSAAPSPNVSKASLYAERARSEESKGLYSQALSDYTLALNNNPDAKLKEELEGEIFVKILPNISPSELTKLRDNSGSAALEVIIGIFLGIKQQEAGDEVGAAETLARVLSRSKETPSSLYPRGRKALDKILKANPGNPERIGVLLQLSGRGAIFGERVLKGALVGARIFTPGANNDQPFTLAVRDTAGDVTQTERALVELVVQEKVTAIIGPLFAHETPPAARLAQELKTPLLTLTQKDDAAIIGEYVFKMGISQKHMMAALADHAILKLHLDRFLILYPTDAYGRELSTLFQEEVTARKGKITALIPYESGKIDFSAELAKISKLQSAVKIPPGSTAAPKNTAGKTTKGPGYDAIFIPDYYRNLVLITPQLAKHKIPGQLLGGNGWNNDYLVDKASRYTQNSIFVDEFFVNSLLPVMKSFVEEYRKKFQDTPSILEAQGAELSGLLYTLFSGAKLSREELKNELTKKDFAYEGLAGTVTLTPQRTALRQPLLLTINAGGIKEVVATP